MQGITTGHGNCQQGILQKHHLICANVVIRQGKNLYKLIAHIIISVLLIIAIFSYFSVNLHFHVANYIQTIIKRFKSLFMSYDDCKSITNYYCYMWQLQPLVSMLLKVSSKWYLYVSIN